MRKRGIHNMCVQNLCESVSYVNFCPVAELTPLVTGNLTIKWQN